MLRGSGLLVALLFVGPALGSRRSLKDFEAEDLEQAATDSAHSAGDLDEAAQALANEVKRDAELSDDEYNLDDSEDAGHENLTEVQVELEPWQEAWLGQVLLEEAEPEKHPFANFDFGGAAVDGEEEDMDDTDDEVGESLAEVGAASDSQRAPWTPWKKVSTKTIVLGKGAHGNVQKVTFGDCGHGWEAAVKTTKIDPEIENEYAVQETCMQSGLSAGVMQTVRTKKKQYALIELGEGGSLKGFINKWRGGLANQDYGRLAQEVFGQLMLVMVQMHKLGIVHEDLKPGNILINHKVCSNPRLVYSAATWNDHGCALKLADFSFACPMEIGCSHKPRGTPAYMAPETWKAGPAEISRDIWAIGVIFYKLLFDCYPYDTEGGLEKLKNAIQTGSKYRMRMAPYNWMPPFSTFTLTNRLWRWAHQILKKTLASPKKRASAKELWHKRYVRMVQRDALNADIAERTTDRRQVPDCVRQAPRRYRGVTVDDVDIRLMENTTQIL